MKIKKHGMNRSDGQKFRVKDDYYIVECPMSAREDYIDTILIVQSAY